MGISVSAFLVTDEQIHDFKRCPAEADALCETLIHRGGEACCYLFDFWAGLDYVLTGSADPVEGPLGALRAGDVRFSPVSDPTWALYSPSVQVLAEALQALTEVELWKRFDPPRMLKPGTGRRPIYPGRLWIGPKKRDGSFRELLLYFNSFRDFAARAAAEQKGLMFCRYEDW